VSTLAWGWDHSGEQRGFTEGGGSLPERGGLGWKCGGRMTRGGGWGGVRLSEDVSGFHC
jgi:hypothetical protein